MDQKEIDLINWCAQYLHAKNVFIDAGARNGNYTILLHNICKYVYCYEPLYKNLEPIMKKIDTVNIIWCSNTLNLQKIKNIGFIKLCHLTLENCSNIINTLHHFPPILFDNIALKQLLLSKHYQVYPINGYDGMYLASDHPDYHLDRLDVYDQIILDNHESPDTINNTLLKALEVMKPIPFTKKINLQCPMSLARVSNNPCIIKIDDGYLCNIRASNYIYDPNFIFLDIDHIHRSDHYQLTLNNEFLIQKMITLTDVTNNVYFKSFVEGIDDLRMFNEEHFICSHGNFNPNGLIEQCLGRIENGRVVSLIALKGPNTFRHEKNWMPFINDDKMHIIYMMHPFILYQIQPDGTMILVKEVVLSNLNMKNFRGSAGPIKYNHGWLATVHQVVSMHYIHRFVWFDEDFTKIKISRPFYFERKGIEFNPGMALHEEGIVLSYSVLDNNSKCIVISNDIINDYIKN